MNLVPHRTALGKRFSEGARLTWIAMRKRGWSQAQLAREIGAPAPRVSRILYGDLVPDMRLAQSIHDRLRVPMVSWTQKPQAEFVTPAAETAPGPAKVRAGRPHKATRKAG